MSLNPEQLYQHCKTILNSRKILNKIVVLCEGKIEIVQGRLSPQSYAQMEQMPDANFYKACVPNWWRQKLPQFFNCGNRKDVIDTYFTLLDLHNKDTNNSYLNPSKLFAIVDLDNQIQQINDDLYSDTEVIFQNLYSKMNVIESNASQHRIWVTGLIHKEAYFLLPELQVIFDDLPVAPTYDNQPLILEDVYLDMCRDISNDIDLQNNIQRACTRIDYCTGLDFTGSEELQNSWEIEYSNAADNVRKEELTIALLTIKKAKDFWNKILPSKEWTRPIDIYKDQLTLEIGRFYSQQENDPKNHIPFFFKILYQFVYK